MGRVVLGIFFVTDTRTVHFIGSVGFYQIDQIGRTAEYRIFIGDRDYWGQGLGTKVTKAMVHYGFDRLNLHTIWLGVNEEHTAAIAVYANAGFLYEGTLRARIYRNGRYYDAVAMSILRSEECLLLCLY
jgi:RimJ/RimL family protein N-acetyltransferase